MSADGTSLGRATWHKLRADRAALASLVFLSGLALLALFAPFWPLAAPNALELTGEAHAPRFAPLFDTGWRHRVALRFRLSEPAPARESLVRTERSLAALVGGIAGATPGLLRHGTGEEAGTLELVLPYRRELDPLRGSDLEARLRSELAGWAGGETHVELAGIEAFDGYGELARFDAWLLACRYELFGMRQLSPWLGTDTKGRDLLARSVFGSRVSLLVGLAGALVSVLVGVVYGALSGYCGGRTDERMMRLVDVLYSIPFLFVVIFVITLLDEYRNELARFGIGRMTAFFVVLGLVTWLTMARVVRAQVLALKQREFVQAARVLGASHLRILGVHVLPHLLGVVVVYLTLTLPSVMLYEAFLSFLGLGVEAPGVSWGLLAADAMDAINPLATAWWLVLGPALFLGATLLALNVLGDGLRDALDPRLAPRARRAAR